MTTQEQANNGNDSGGLTPEKLIERLRTALKRDGDFPASAKVVSELRRLTGDPKTSAHQITEVILKEPSLGTRVLHLVNSSFYRRAKPIMTVSQAVVQIGMKPLAELCSGLILLQKFVPAARKGGAFANCLQKTICTALLASELSPAMADNRGESNDELGYLAGSFAEMGSLLLAYYFPQVYENAVKRSKQKNQNINQSIKELTGLSPLQLSLEVLEALQMPPFYKDILSNLEKPAATENTPTKTLQTANINIGAAVDALRAAERISNVVVYKSSKQELDTVLADIKKISGIDSKKLNVIVGELPQKFREHCSTIEVNLTSLPDFVSHYSSAPKSAGPEQNDIDNFQHFLDEIRQTIESREPASAVITTVMETLAWGLKFDRVLLLLVGADKRRLLGRMLLGKADTDPKSLVRPLRPEASPLAPDAMAFAENRPYFTGNPIFEGGWPLAAIPVGLGARAIGIIYADRTTSEKELSDREKAAIGVLAELLDRALGTTS